WCGPIDGQENGPQMPFKVRSQCIDMCPLQGGFVEFDVRGDMLGDQVDVGTVQNTEGLGSDFVEGRLCGNAWIRKESENLRRFVQLLVAFATMLVYLLFGLFLRRFTVLPDVMDEALNQIVMQLLVAVIDKT